MMVKTKDAGRIRLALNKALEARRRSPNTPKQAKKAKAGPKSLIKLEATLAAWACTPGHCFQAKSRLPPFKSASLTDPTNPASIPVYWLRKSTQKKELTPAG